MRSVVSAWVALALLAAHPRARAEAGGALDRLDAQAAVAMTGGTLRVHRWGLGLKGKRATELAARRCAARSMVAVTTHRTLGDVAAALFTLGWYTPLHATYACAPSTNP